MGVWMLWSSVLVSLLTATGIEINPCSGREDERRTKKKLELKAGTGKDIMIEWKGEIK